MYRKLSVVITSLLFFVNPYVFGQYDIQTVPNPKNHGQQYFVANPDGILSHSTVVDLNTMSQRIDSLVGAEFAIVMLNDYMGDSAFEFALALFNYWGIGKKETNNGLLLFIAKDRQEYRFISGYGMESILPDAYLKRIGETYLVPNFRNGDYDQGVLEASQFIEEILKSPDSVAELARLMPDVAPFWSMRNPILMDTLWMFLLFAGLYLYAHYITIHILKGTKTNLKLIAPIFQGMGCMLFLMFVTLFIFAFIFNNLEEIYQRKNLPYFAFVLFTLIFAMKISNGKTQILQSFKDEEDLQKCLKKYVTYLCIPMLISPLAWIDLGTILNRFRRNLGRFTPPDATGNWVRINRGDQSFKPHQYLASGQTKEEAIGSLRYEIWSNTVTKEVRLLQWDKSSKYRDCPECHYYTFEVNKTKTIRKATYSSSGKGEKYDSCRNCTYFRHIKFFTIPMKTRSSSSSSSGGRSSSGGGGSFGGGSSGGGGAGGRW